MKKIYSYLDNYLSLCVVENIDAKVDIDNAIGKLSELERFIVVVHLIDGWAVEDCMRWTGKSKETITTTRHRAANKLEKYINGR